MSVMVQDPKKSFQATYLTPLLAGAVAGLSVDVALYPLDTLKTRLQSAQGFQNAGGFKGVYRGLLTVATTSVPTASLFFMSYEATKTIFEPLVRPQYAPFVHMFAASVGEVLACVIRVPTEIAKQRKQTYVGSAKKSSIGILIEIVKSVLNSAVTHTTLQQQSSTYVSLLHGASSGVFRSCRSIIDSWLVTDVTAAYRTEGFFRGVYRGFFSTVLRDLPFSFIELPVWEMLKTIVRKQNNGEVTSFQSAVCGSIAGGFAAGVTTPLDLVKTRIMLAEVSTRDSQVSTRDGQVSTRDGQVSARNGQVSVNRLRIHNVLCEIYNDKGVRGLFAGVTPRVTAFMMGGFVFFGVYDFAKSFLETRVW